jgi:hypothetical protein
LLLLVLALGAVGAVIVLRRSPGPAETVMSAPATPEPAAVPPDSRPARRPRIRRVGPPAKRATPAPATPAPSIQREVAATVRRNQAGIRICYERALKLNGSLKMRIDVQVRIRPTGAVEQVSLDPPSGPPPELLSCITNMIRTWRFPNAPETYGSAFPLHLQPGQ